MKLLYKYIVLLVLISLQSCVESFDPEIPDGDVSFLVIDGVITDQPGPYTISISQTSPLNGENTFISGVSVFIEEENGSLDELTEITPGIYQTNAVQGEVGKSYRLKFSYREEQYESTWETIQASPTIDSVYFLEETRETTDRENNLLGLQFFIDSQGPENTARYFRYELEETWQMEVAWPSRFDYLGNDEFEPTAQLFFPCWKDGSFVGINIATTQNLDKNVLSAHPLKFNLGDDERFTRRYSLLVKQFAFDENEFFFWKNLRESNQELGSLFDRQPAQVSGNITNMSNPDNVALGYFSASGLTEKRIFIGKEEVSRDLSRQPFCADLDSILKVDFGPEYDNTIFQKIDNGFFFHSFIFNNATQQLIGATLSPARCSDCRLKGGVLTKPEFWDE